MMISLIGSFQTHPLLKILLKIILKNNIENDKILLISEKPTQEKPSKIGPKIKKKPHICGSSSLVEARGVEPHANAYISGLYGGLLKKLTKC